MPIVVEAPDRVVVSMDRLARETAWADVDGVLDRCLADVDLLHDAKRITEEQREALRFLLLGIGLRSA